MKKIQIIFIVAVLLCLSYPIARFHSKITVSAVENRNLAPKPVLIKDGNFNTNIFPETDLYLQDHFGGRETLVNIANFIDYNVFHKLHMNDRALEGKDGWFFYKDGGDNLLDFQKKNLFSDQEIEDFTNRIYNTAKWCNENGIKYIFVIGPNKHSVYSEKYPFKRPDGITRADQISKIFSELKLPYVYSRDKLISKKSENDVPLYYETDTHWNPLGAYYCFEDIFTEIKKLFSDVQFPEIEYERNVTYSETAGDILPMLGIKKAKSTQVSLLPKGAAESDYFEYIKNEGTKGVITAGKNQNLPKAILFRDSFTTALTPFLAPLFSSAEYNWKQFRESDKEYVLQNKPDLIIFESVERYSRTIVN